MALPFTCVCKKYRVDPGRAFRVTLGCLAHSTCGHNAAVLPRGALLKSGHWCCDSPALVPVCMCVLSLASLPSVSP